MTPQEFINKFVRSFDWPKAEIELQRMLDAERTYGEWDAEGKY